MRRLPIFPCFLTAFFLSTIAFSQVAVVRMAGLAAYDDARNGFASTCFQDIQEFVLDEGGSGQEDLAAQIQAGNFKLIFAIGQPAAEFAQTNFPDIPLVYCLIVSRDQKSLAGDNTTGVFLAVPIREQFTVLKSISKKIKKIGVIYTQPANNDLVARAQEIASELSLTLVTVPLSGSQDIQKAMTELVGKCDALWIPPDPSLTSDEVIRYIGSTSLSKQIPCVGPSEKYVRAGAIFSLAPDPVEAGRIAGDMATQIIQGVPPSKIPVVGMLKPKSIFNLRAAGLMGLSIPKDLQSGASKLYQ